MPMKAAKLKMLRSAWTLSVLGSRYIFIYMLTLCIALPPSWSIPAVIDADTAYANSYPIAYSKYEKGDFKGAEAALKQSLKKKLSKDEQAKTYKLLGICSYMLGNKAAATDNFKRALKLAPKTVIIQSEVLDDSVIGFFSNIKGGGKKAPPTAKVATKVATKPAPLKPVTTAKNTPPAKMTYLKVLSNVSTASVAIDGILAGQANTLINTDAGKIEIEVSAQGHITKKISVNITANQENSITVNLLKPQPKPKPKPKPIVKKKPKQQQQQYDQVLVKKKKKKKMKSNKYAPDPGGDMFVDEGGGAPGGPDTATQFDMDTGGGYPAQPGYGAQPGYNAPPAYNQPPPGYGPPPAYYAPPPTYYAPPPQPVYVPPPPPPPGDPYAGGGYADPNAPPVDIAADPAAPASNAGSAENGGGRSMLYTILPFGAGQFQNESYILGTAFLGAEAFALYFWYSKGNEATAFAANATKYLTENCTGAESDEEACEKYRVESQAYTDETNSKAQMGLYGFIGLWVVGVAEAIINEPAPQSKGGRKKKGRYAGIHYSPTPDGHHFSLVGHEYDNKLFAYDVGVDIAPTYSFESDKIENQLSLSLKLSF